MTQTSIYNQNLDKNAANFAPLSPLSFLRRAATLYPKHPAVIHGNLHRSWAEVYTRCVQLADALTRQGIRRGETVSVLLPNTPEMYEVHFGVPMAGAVLNAINTRLDARAVAFILQHAEAKILIVDPEFGEVAQAALEQIENKPLVIYTEDPLFDGGQKIGEISYDDFLAKGSVDFAWELPGDEWDAISLNYTSGTTGDPKGVVYHHRGAYLNAVNNIVCWHMESHPVYLWTLPMFHCNGWCFPWTLAAQVGTNVCLRHVREEPIYAAIKEHKVSHFCGAPVVLNTLANADPALKEGIDHKVKVMTAGAAPPAAVIAGMERIGIEVTQVYGLTETYGPMVVSAWQSKWDEVDFDERCRLKARQGIAGVLAEDLMVADPETLEELPWDGETQGEIFMRGNITMKGYLKNPETTEKSFAGGWFHSGDLAVRHPDGYIQIKDRSKDIIISGGENISSLEVESVLFSHPAVLEAAVVAKEDEKWGEVPCAFVSLKPGAQATAEELIAYCRENMARFKCPKHVVFGPLEKTSTGKVQKYLLRERAKSI
ncbi:acyl-CoA synthetase [Proteobacteria bacterium 005FR1]|nr:acyl-CoA synthetase [Proteobacteria bacterium 005FR1]